MNERGGGERVRIGVIGLGRHGSRYAQHILNGDVPNAVLAAVNRRDEDLGAQFAREHGCRYYACTGKLLADQDVDAVIITVPTKLHFEAAVAAARAGKHILCEKPIARTVDEGLQMVDVARAKGVKLAAAQTMRFTPVFAALRERLPAIGPLLHIRMCISQERTGIPWHLDADMAGGGALMEVGVHLFDTIHYVTGRRIEKVMCEARDTDGVGVETIASGILWLEGGITAGFDCAKCVDGRITRLEAVGDAGQLVADATAGSLMQITGRTAAPVDVAISGMTIPPLLAAFCEAVLRDGPVPVPPADAIHALAVCEAAYASAADGIPCDVRSSKPLPGSATPHPSATRRLLTPRS